MNPMLRAVIVALIILSVRAAAAMGQGSVVAHGGGADWELESHREMVRWMINQAAAGREGDGKVRVVVLGAVPREPGEPDAAADAFRREGAAAEALVITGENADAPETAAAIESARIVWIRGGNQWRYVNWWKGTATERAIRKVFEAGGVVGGTSAGCAILGEVTYDARNGSLRPEQALADSHHENLTLTDGFLNLVPGVLFDSHFTERGRIGRLPVMMARAARDCGTDVLGVGVDHGTALMIDAGGWSTVIGRGTVALLSFQQNTTIALRPGAPPHIVDVLYDRLARGGVYNVKTRRAEVLPGIVPSFAVPGEGERYYRVVTETWKQDGDIESRIDQAHQSLCSISPANVLLIGTGIDVLRNGHGHPRPYLVDEFKGAPEAFLHLTHDGMIVGNKRRLLESSRLGLSFTGAFISILPPQRATATDGGETAAPATTPD